MTRRISSWFPIVGVALGSLTLIFLMGFVALATAGTQVPCDSRFLVVSVLALGAALASSFLGGSAAAEGVFPLPFAKDHPLKFSVTGGIAVLIIVLFAGSRLYVPAAGCGMPPLETTAAYQLVDALQKSEPGEEQVSRLQQYAANHTYGLSALGLNATDYWSGELGARMLGRFAVIYSSKSPRWQGDFITFIHADNNRVYLKDDEFGGGVVAVRFIEGGAAVYPNALVEVTYVTITGTGTYGESTKIYTITDNMVVLSLDKPSFEYNSGWGAFEGELVEFKTKNVFQVDPSTATYEIRTIGAASVMSYDPDAPCVNQLHDRGCIVAWQALPDELYVWNRLSRQFHQTEGRVVAGQELMTSIYSDYASPVGDWFQKPAELQGSSVLDLLYAEE